MANAAAAMRMVTLGGDAAASTEQGRMRFILDSGEEPRVSRATSAPKRVHRVR
jgi:hypothetical protein